MSVWSDMGAAGGRMNGVDPGTFLNAACAFFREIRRRSWPDGRSRFPEWDFSLRRKAGERELSTWNEWLLLGKYLSFPTEIEELGRPIPEIYWNSLPRWSDIFTQNERTLLQEEILPCPYGETIIGPEIMDPAWPLQRLEVIRKMRYMTVPLNIRTREYDESSGTCRWFDYSGVYPNSVNREDFRWNGQTNEGQYVQVEAQIPEYWTRGDTVCRIGYQGGWKWSYQEEYSGPPPINGCAWVNGARYLSGAYAGPGSGPAVVRLFGAADLATHPDFSRYFDV